ncbi:MAG: RNA 2'-phosphotransferase [Candidatus Asgardarchaeia archaeon]
MVKESKIFYKCVVCGKIVTDSTHCGRNAIRLMNNYQRKRLSKFLSYVLRHNPKVLNLELDDQGFTTISINELAARIAKKSNFSWVTPEHIYAVVEVDEKGRFEIKNERIRAVYGHTLDLGLNYPSLSKSELPQELYHGTTSRVIHKILSEGIKPMRRKYVHLTINFDDAIEVGKRRKGNVIVLIVNPKIVLEKGYKIYKANEKIFLTEHVPPDAIKEVKRIYE